MNLSPTLWNKNYSDLLRTYSDNTKNRAFRPHVLLVSMYIHSSPTQHPRHTKSTVSNKQCTSKRPKKIHLTYHIARLDCRTILLHNHIKFSRRRWLFQTHQHIILMSAPQSLPLPYVPGCRNRQLSRMHFPFEKSRHTGIFYTSLHLCTSTSGVVTATHHTTSQTLPFAGS